MATARENTGASATFSDFGVAVGWSSPDTLETGLDYLFERIPLPKAVTVKKLRATVETAPTGAAILVDVYLGTITTGVLDGSPIGQISIAIGAFYGELVLSPFVDWPVTKFAVPALVQVGSVVAGRTLLVTLEGQVAA